MDFIMGGFSPKTEDNVFNVLDPLGDGSAIAYYPFDGDSTDMISANNGTDTGTAYEAGIIDQCLSLDGTGYVHTDHRVPLPEDFSVSLWVNKSVKHDGWIVENRSANVEAESEFQIGFYNTANHLFFNIKTEDDWFTAEATSIPYDGNENEWFYVTGAVSNNEVKVYVNGVLENTTPYTGTRNKGATFTGFGCLWTSNYKFKGKMEKCHFFNKGLTDEDVSYLHARMSS